MARGSLQPWCDYKVSQTLEGYWGFQVVGLTKRFFQDFRPPKIFNICCKKRGLGPRALNQRAGRGRRPSPGGSGGQEPPRVGYGMFSINEGYLAVCVCLCVWRGVCIVNTEEYGLFFTLRCVIS